MEHTTKITILEEQMKQVNGKLDSLERKIDKGFSDVKQELGCYVRKEEFVTVRAIVYGMVGAVLSAFVTALIYLVFK